jgi:hypothetical protein
VPSEIAQLYGALLHRVVAGLNLTVTDTAPTGGNTFTLFTTWDTNFCDSTLYAVVIGSRQVLDPKDRTFFAAEPYT